MLKTPPTAAAPSRSSTPAPIPSLLTGRAACDACLAAEKAGRYLTPQGVGHYLQGCQDEPVRQQCLAATKRSIPRHVRELASQHQCDDARLIAEFADRHGVSSPALRAAIAKCDKQ